MIRAPSVRRPIRPRAERPPRAALAKKAHDLVALNLRGPTGVRLLPLCRLDDVQ